MAQSSPASNEEKFIVGLEIGSSSAKIGVAGFNPSDPKHVLTIYNSASLPTVDSVCYGRITNIREVTEVVNSLLEKVEKHAPIENRDITGVYISIGGRTLKSRKASARKVLPDRREITEELVESLCDEAIETLSSNLELLCVEPNRYMVDNIRSPRPVGTLGTRLFGEFTAVVCDPANKNDITEVVCNRVGLNVCGISVRPIALAHLVLSPQETNAGCMLVDLGAETTTVAIFKRSTLHYLATIPLGSRLITKDLAHIMALTEEDAESLKITLANAVPDGSVPNGVDERMLRDVNTIVSARLNDIVANIAAQPEFAGLTREDLPAGIILTGGGAKLRNFARLLDAHTRMKVRIATLPADIVVCDSNLTAADNLDLIALLNEAAEAARTGDNEECLSIPEPTRLAAAAKEDEKVAFFVTGGDVNTDNEKDIPSDGEIFIRGHGEYGYEAGDFGGRYSEPKDFSPGDNDKYIDDPDDDIYELLDDDKADRLRRENARRKAATEEARRTADDKRRKAEEARNKRLKEKEKKKNTGDPDEKMPSRVDKLISKLTGFLSSTGEDGSADLDE